MGNLTGIEERIVKGMNNCIFMGYFVEDPVIKQIDNNSWLTTFNLGVVRHFKKANGTKSNETTVLSMQVWDSGAIKIADDFIQNDFIIVECTAKNLDGSKIVFRVNKFYPVRQSAGTPELQNREN